MEVSALDKVYVIGERVGVELEEAGNGPCLFTSARSKFACTAGLMIGLAGLPAPAQMVSLKTNGTLATILGLEIQHWLDLSPNGIWNAKFHYGLNYSQFRVLPEVNLPGQENGFTFNTIGASLAAVQAIIDLVSIDTAIADERGTDQVFVPRQCCFGNTPFPATDPLLQMIDHHPLPTCLTFPFDGLPFNGLQGSILGTVDALVLFVAVPEPGMPLLMLVGAVAFTCRHRH